MKPPAKLYRYRPLDDQLLKPDQTLFDRELKALRESYLFAPPFRAMNDPMEAFYETGGPGDGIIDALLAPTGRKVAEMYDMLSKSIDRFALVSFSGTHEDLPLWAYYASNFAGMCLEFDTAELAIGDFQNENLRPVNYAETALPPFTLADFGDKSGEAMIARITRKRIEWAHEKEWRYLTGEVGPKHYLDDALCRVFLGPRIKAEHATRICELLRRRPVEVLQGEIRGFELGFRRIQAPCPIEVCERVGAGRFDRTECDFPEEELRSFLGERYHLLVEECRRVARRPNTEEIFSAAISSTEKETIYLSTQVKLRNDRTTYFKRYFDRSFQQVPSPNIAPSPITSDNS